MRRLAACFLAVVLACAAQNSRSGRPLDRAKAASYRTYFEAFKKVVRDKWTALVVDRIKTEDPTGCKFSAVDRDVVLNFRLQADGRIRDVTVAESAQVAYIDQMAVEALEAVSPITAPPPGLLDADGTVRLPFVFKLLKPEAGCAEAAK
jgi:TonB family protein